MSSGRDLPDTTAGGSSWYAIARSVASRVAAQTTTVSCGAYACSRDAVFTTLPLTIPTPPSCAAATSTITSPVANPTRVATRNPPPSGRPRNASWMPSPARTAAAAPSARWCVDRPNTAMTASPTYFSTTPPQPRTTADTAAK
jgi:hypothetical protein